MEAFPQPLRITVLGSGTSTGVPTIGCDCEVCTSSDPRDKRLRPSVLVSFGARHILIDTTPDLRTQMLREGIRHLDAVLYTHAHADHIMGLDDVRPFNYRRKEPIPIYGSAETIESVRRCFSYIFNVLKPESSIPRIVPRDFDGQALDLFGLPVLPVPLKHGRATIHGFRFGAAAYLTDHSEIPAESLALLEGLDVLFLDALRFKPHPTHSTIQQSLATVERLAPRRAFFTHLCHDVLHARVEETLPPHVRLAYDGLRIDVEDR